MPLDTGRKKDGAWSEIRVLENEQKKSGLYALHWCDF